MDHIDSRRPIRYLCIPYIDVAKLATLHCAELSPFLISYHTYIFPPVSVLSVSPPSYDSNKIP